MSTLGHFGGALRSAWSTLGRKPSLGSLQHEPADPSSEPDNYEPAFTSPARPRFRRNNRSAARTALTLGQRPARSREPSVSSIEEVEEPEPGAEAVEREGWEGSESDELAEIARWLDSPLPRRAANVYNTGSRKEWVCEASPPALPAGRAGSPGSLRRARALEADSDSSHALLAAFPSPPTSHPASDHWSSAFPLDAYLDPPPQLGAPFAPSQAAATYASPTFSFSPPTPETMHAFAALPAGAPARLPMDVPSGMQGWRKGSLPGEPDAPAGPVVRRRASESILGRRQETQASPSFDPTRPPLITLPPLPTRFPTPPGPPPSSSLPSVPPTRPLPPLPISTQPSSRMSFKPLPLLPSVPEGLGITVADFPAPPRHGLRASKSLFSLRSTAASPLPSPAREEVSFDDLTSVPLPRRRVSRRRSSLFLEGRSVGQAGGASPPLVQVSGSRSQSGSGAASPVASPRRSAVPPAAAACGLVRASSQAETGQDEESVSETDSEIDLDASLEAMAWRAGVMTRSSSTGEAEPKEQESRLGAVRGRGASRTRAPPSRKSAGGVRSGAGQGMAVGKVDVYKLVRKPVREPEEKDGAETSEEDERFDMMMDLERRGVACSPGSVGSVTESTAGVLSPFSVRSAGSEVWRTPELEPLPTPPRSVEAGRAARELHRAMAAQRGLRVDLQAASGAALTHGDSSEAESPVDRMATPKPSTGGRRLASPPRKPGPPPPPTRALPAPPKLPSSFNPIRRPSDAPSIESAASAAPTELLSSGSSDSTRRSSVASSAGGLASPTGAKSGEPAPPPPSLLRKPSAAGLRPLALARPNGGAAGSASSSEPARSDSVKKARRGEKQKENAAQPTSLPRPASAARPRIPTLRNAKSAASLGTARPTPSAASPVRSATPVPASPILPRSTTPSGLPKPASRTSAHASLKLPTKPAVPPVPVPRAHTIGGPPTGSTVPKAQTRRKPSLSSLQYVGAGTPALAGEAGLVLPRMVAARSGVPGPVQARDGSRLARPIASGVRREVGV